MRARGFVLVNALVIAAAIALIAVALLMRTQTAQSGRGYDQTRWQLERYMDGVEALVIGRLARDLTGSVADHDRESWARDTGGAEIDRGKVTVAVRDAQGLFNLNWIAGDDTGRAAEEFRRAARSNGLPPSVAETVIAHLNTVGALSMVEALGPLSGIPQTHLATLGGFAAAIPGDRALNMNTSDETVLSALLPSMNAALFLLIERNRPFESTTDFRDLLLDNMDAEDFDAVPFERLGVSSRWFELEISAELDGKAARRRTLLERIPSPGVTKVAYRLRLPG
ncbi:type II secretion system protein GspK [Primorskyibacter aestuariivivens]|uniref:general secretion pathway protein GspK n=1 Tax=Primorskyibacter aestuariivivens TaxID=1888912 RepID=UPI002300D2CE|nr:type II secretion system protein GspK [Primorskyibacter aestuariivivens]MDA7426913.1 type II secretion system protein GspK [Primorskyibacter aestuariivivens]